MLSPKEQQTIDFINDYLAKHGYSPTLPEIAEALGLSSKGGISKRIKTLVSKGYLEQAAGWRGIRPTQPAGSLPMLGRIAAGQPIEAVANPEHLDIGGLFVGAGRYVLEVQGESMIDVGIMDGDLAIIQSSDTARDGQIIVALINNETTSLKRLEKQNNEYITLVAENKNMQPIVVHAGELQIQGILIGVIRQY